MKRVLVLLLLFPLFMISCKNNELSINNIPIPNNDILLSYIKITPPLKVKYSVGESFDSTGLSVNAYYSDGSSKDVTDNVLITGFDSSKENDNQIIIVSYSESDITKSASFYISIEKTYTVIFISNNSAQQEKRQIIYLSSDEKLDDNSFNLGNYSFYKWNTRSDGSGTSYKNSAMTTELEFEYEQDTIKLYAQWTSSIPIIISKDNYQTVFQDLENISSKEYLFYCIDELSSEMFTSIKDAIYNLYEVNIQLDFSAVTCDTSIDFLDRDYSNLISVQLPKIINRQNYGFRFKNVSNLKYVKLDEKTTYIGDFAFNGCESLESIIIPNSVKEISSNAFSLCKNLKEIIIPDTVSKLGYNVFSNCTQLKTVQLSNSISDIGDSLFAGCTNLETISIPEKVTRIGNNAFFECIKLKEILLPDSVNKIGYMAFENCNNLETFIMGKNVNTIDFSAFTNCSKLTNIKLSDGLASIPPNIFYGCINITNIIIPDRVNTIEGLSYCTNLQNITIGKGIKTIYSNAFSGCTNLSEVTFSTHSNWRLTKEEIDPFNGDSITTDVTTISASDFTDTSLIATYLKETYKNYKWERIN